MATNSPISGKTIGAITSEAVDAGASLEDITGSLRGSADQYVTPGPEPVQADIPLGEEFDAPTKTVGPVERPAGIPITWIPDEEEAIYPTPVTYDTTDPEFVAPPIVEEPLPQDVPPPEDEAPAGPTPHETFVGEETQRATEGPSTDAIGPVTESGKQRSLVHDLIIPRAAGTYDQTAADPTWLSSTGWVISDGLGFWGASAMRQALEVEDPEAQSQINAHFEELTYGVSEEYHEHIKNQPNFAAAEREADKLRTEHYRTQLRANENLAQGLTTGFAGFVLDPINLVPGGVIVKGLSMSAKLATAAGLRGAAGTTLAKRSAVWGTAGGVEELARNAPRYMTDPTYTADRYLTDAAMGLGFGAGIPALGMAARAAAGKVPAYVQNIRLAGEQLGIDQAYRSTVNTAFKVADQVAGKDGGITAKAKAVDLSKAIKDAKVKTKNAVSAQFRELRDLDIMTPIREAMDKSDTAAVHASIRGSFNKILEAVDKRSKNVDPEKSAAAKESIGAAKREDSAKVKLEDAVEDIRATARQAKKEAKDAAEAAHKYLDESDMPADAKENLRYLIERSRAQAESAIDDALNRKGYKPERKTLNNADHTASLVRGGQNLRSAMTKVFNRLEKIPGVNFGKIASKAMKNAYKSAGITKLEGKTWAESMQESLKGMSHVQRRAAISRMADEWTHSMQRAREAIDADPNLTHSQREQALRQMLDAEAEVNMQMDLLDALARNPFEDALVTGAQWQQISAAWRETGNMETLAKDFNDSKIQSAVKHQFAHLTESLASRMMKSQAPLAQWFTANVLETPSGFGGQMDRNPLTAAIYAENLDNTARRPVLLGWETMMREVADAEGWGILRRITNKQGNAKTHKDVRRISKEVQLEMNARHFGTTSDASPAVKKFADVLDAEYSKLHDLQNGHVEGIHAGNKIDNYQHQVWDDRKILDLLGDDVGRKGLTDLFRQGYLNAGMDMRKASIMAKAMIDQKAAAAARPRGHEVIGAEQIQGAMPALTEIVERMRKNGVDEDTVLEIVDTINKAGKGEVPGYAKSRVPVDLNASAVINGKTVRIVDIMDNDVPAIFTRYSKEATARRAISESTGGVLNSDKQMNSMLTNMALEAQELGAVVDTRAARNALQIMMGKQYDGQLPMDVRRARDAVSLAGMGGLGESQLAEFGLAVARGMSGLVGAMQKFRVAGANQNKKWRGIELTPAQAADHRFLSELQEVSGLFGDMYLIDRRNVHFDADEANTKALSKVVDTLTGGKFRPLLQHMQTRFTGYGAIRKFEDQIAMASLVHDMAKHFTGRKAYTSEPRMRDLGIPAGDDSWLAKAFRDHVTYKEDGTVENLNLHQWSQMDKNKMGVILNRYASQQVQKGFVGESSPEMMNPWVSFMMQFKSYPMLAAEKQQARHLKFADKEAAVGILLNAASSGAARAIRYHSMAASLPEKDREAYLERKFGDDWARDTFAYMGTAGMLLESTKLGYGAVTGNAIGGGQFSWSDQLPVLNYMDQYSKALAGPLDGDISDRDVRNVQMAAPLGTIAQSNVLFGIVQGMMDEE